jgi:hypothetical protein
MELRVHGIGGPDPEAILGCEDQGVVRRWPVRPAARTGVFTSPGDPSVGAYHWSSLTSGSRSFVVWPLLLPFTLANLVGYMAPPGRRRGRAYRVVAHVFAGSITVATVLWSNVGAWAVQGRFSDAALARWLGWLPGTMADARFWLAHALTALALVVLVLGATYAAEGFERYRPPFWDEPGWERRRGAGLADPGFFDNRAAHRRRWGVHVFLTVATWGWVAWQVLVGVILARSWK